MSKVVISMQIHCNVHNNLAIKSGVLLKLQQFSYSMLKNVFTVHVMFEFPFIYNFSQYELISKKCLKALKFENIKFAVHMMFNLKKIYKYVTFPLTLK